MFLSYFHESCFYHIQQQQELLKHYADLHHTAKMSNVFWPKYGISFFFPYILTYFIWNLYIINYFK